MLRSYTPSVPRTHCITAQKRDSILCGAIGTQVQNTVIMMSANAMLRIKLKKKKGAKVKKKTVWFPALRQVQPTCWFFYNTSTTKGSGRGISIVSSPAVHTGSYLALSTRFQCFLNTKITPANSFSATFSKGKHSGSGGIIPSLLASTTKSQTTQLTFCSTEGQALGMSGERKEARTIQVILPCSAFPANAYTLPTTTPEQE